MKKLLLLTALSSSLLFSNNISIDSIGLNIGNSYSSFYKKDRSGSISLGNKPDESFSSFEIFTTLNGVCKKEDMKPYISYSYSSNDDLKHRYVLAGVNKYYPYKKTSLYAGVLLGYGQVDWKYDPLNTSKGINSDANSFIAGVQGGIDYPLIENLFLGLNAKALLHDYETKLNPTAGVSSKIEHKSTFSLMLGINYRF